MLRARTGSALARAFKRFARCAVAGLALAGLAACGGGGGGGSSTPAETTPTTPDPDPAPEIPTTPDPDPAPEIPITPSSISDILAEAIDITGMETVEGELDSADDMDYYEIRVDEPTEVTLWVDTADVGFQVLDSEGKVLVASSQNSGGGSSSGLAAASAATPQAIPAVGCALPGVNVVCVRLMLTVGSAIVRVVARRAIKRGTKYALRQAVRAGAFIRVLGPVVLKNLEVGKPVEIDCRNFFAPTEEAIPLSCSARVVSLNLGPYRIGIQAEGSIARLDPFSTSICRDRAAPKTAKLALIGSARVPPGGRVPKEIRDGVEKVSGITFFGTTLFDNGPRLVPGGPPLSLTVAEGGSAKITLTDHIEDPDEGSLTFDVGSAPAGLSVTRDGPRLTRLTVRAREGAADGSITVAATGQNNVCRTFPLRVSVGGTLKVKPEYSDGVTKSIVAGNEFDPGDLSEYFDNPLDEDLRFTVAHTGGSLRYEGGPGHDGGGGSFSADWWFFVAGNRLSVNSGSSMPDGRHIRLRLTAENSAGAASLEFTITIVKPSGLPLYACYDDSSNPSAWEDCEAWWSNAEHAAARCEGERRVSQCPTTGGQYRDIGSCRTGSVINYWYYPHGHLGSPPRYLCDRWGGVWTRHK